MTFKLVGGLMWHQKFRSPTTSSSSWEKRSRACHPSGQAPAPVLFWRAFAALSFKCRLLNIPSQKWIGIFWYRGDAKRGGRGHGLHTDGHSYETSSLPCRVGKLGEDASFSRSRVSIQTGENQWRSNTGQGGQPVKPVTPPTSLGSTTPRVPVGMQILYITRYRIISKSNRHRLSFQHSAKRLFCVPSMGDMM